MYVFANSTASVAWGGGVVRLHLGDPWPADDPFVKARPEFFASDPPSATVRRTSAPIEQATAAPGERRNTRRAR